MLQDLRHSAADEAHLVHEDMKTHPLDSALLLALRFLLGAGHPRRVASPLLDGNCFNPNNSESSGIASVPSLRLLAKLGTCMLPSTFRMSWFWLWIGSWHDSQTCSWQNFQTANRSLIHCTCNGDLGLLRRAPRPKKSLKRTCSLTDWVDCRWGTGWLHWPSDWLCVTNQTV